MKVTRVIGAVLLGLWLASGPRYASTGSSSSRNAASATDSFTELTSIQTATATSGTVPFANFAVTVEAKESELDVKGTFTLGAASNGINLFKEEITVKLGSLPTTIPAGSFKRDAKGNVEFKKLIDCRYWKVAFRPLGKNSFEVDLELEGVRGSEPVTPKDVTFTIGDDGGSAKGQ